MCCEREAGSLTPGKQADLVQLAQDPLAHDPARLADIQVTATWVAGDLGYRPQRTVQS